MKQIYLCLVVTTLVSCGSSSPTRPSSAPSGQSGIPQARMEPASPISWTSTDGNGRNDTTSQFSGDLKNAGAGCTDGDVTGIATLYSGTEVLTSGLYFAEANTITKQIAPGKVVRYTGVLIPGVTRAQSDRVTSYNLTFQFTSAKCL